MDLAKVSKAIAGALVALLVAFLARKGVTLTTEVAGALGVLLDVLVAMGVGFLAVYLAPKNKETK